LDFMILQIDFITFFSKAKTVKIGKVN